jgi:hypothetical protein
MILIARPSSYPAELLERAVRMVIESKADYGTEYQAIRSISAKLGIRSPESRLVQDPGPLRDQTDFSMTGSSLKCFQARFPREPSLKFVAGAGFEPATSGL